MKAKYNTCQVHGCTCVYIHVHACTSIFTIPSPEDLPNPGIQPGSPASQADSLPAELPGKPQVYVHICLFVIYKYFRYFLSHVSKCMLKQILILWIFAQRSPFSLSVSPGVPRCVQRGECQRKCLSGGDALSLSLVQSIAALAAANCEFFPVSSSSD